MEKSITGHRRTAAILLSALVCSSFLPGCSKTSPDPAVPKDTAIAQIADTTVTVGSISCDSMTQELTVVNPVPEELHQILPMLPQLKTLVLEGNPLAGEDLLQIKSQYPAVSLFSQIDLGGTILSTGLESLDLHEVSVDYRLLKEYLPLFPNLKEVSLAGTELTDTEKMEVCDSLSGILVRCELPLAGQYFPSDSTEIDISGCPVTAEQIEQMLPYFPLLEKLDMSFCGISDEEMDAMNQRHPEISIVWTVTIGMVKTRTDAVYFYPAEANYYPTNEEMKKLRYCTELVAIDIGHTRATDCEFLWYTPKVRYLILADTGITDITPVGNLKELIYLELFNLRTDDYSPLLNCTKLQDLNIGTTHADPEPLSKMTWLHNLQWHRADQNPATKEAVLKLPEQLPDTNVDLYPKKKARNIGGGWRYIPNYYVFRDIIGATYFNQDQIWDYWGQEDGDRIMACESGKSFAAYTLAEIVRERIDNEEPIIGVKYYDSEKAEILYQTLLEAESWIKKE